MNSPSTVGVAIDYVRSWGMAAIWARVRDLAARLRFALQDLPGVAVQDLEQQCGIVSFTVAGQDARAVHEALRAQQINVSVSTLTSTRLDMTARCRSSLASLWRHRLIMVDRGRASPDPHRCPNARPSAAVQQA
jgi:selenocysteine lyase/cysteine desulfurase